MASDQETARTLYKKLLGLYPRAFREQLGESMEQTFNDRFNERKQQTERGLFRFVLGMFVETAGGIIRERTLLITQGNTMKNLLITPRSAAIISCMLCLPFAFLFTLLLLNIEPDFGALEPLLTSPDPDQPDVLGSLIVLGTVLLALAAFIISLIPIVRTMRGGESIRAYPVNVIVAVATLAPIVIFIGLIIVDQYPCWIGVPNCD